MTDAEKRLWSKLRRVQLGARFRRQQPIGPYIVDFYCAAARLVVEVDGGQHSEMQRAYDSRRDGWLRDEGYSVLRFWNNEVLANTDGVLTEVTLALEAAGVREDADRIPLPLGEGQVEGVSSSTSMPPSVPSRPPLTPPPNPLPQGEGRSVLSRPAAAFAVRRLELTAFRSWRRARLETPARCVVLTGPNGAGKTNLLEALSLLAPGRGLRRARMADLQRRGDSATGSEANWAVSAWLDTPEGLRRVGTGRDSTRDSGRDSTGDSTGDSKGAPDGDSGAAPARRILRIDGVPARGQGELSDLGAVVWLTPEMDGLFTGPAGERRRFLDRLVAGFLPRHATRLAAYEKAMRERNRLLRSPRPDPAWLDALEAAMAERGVAVAAARADFTARLAAACAGRVSAFPAPALALEGGEGPMAAEGPALEAEEALKERLKASRAADAEAGRALAGPHRVDLAVHFTASGRAGEMPAAACSTGEQKALLIALVLAAARLLAVERGAAPMLLLDEVAAHLDRHRRAALFHEIEELGAQAWMTGTDAGLFDALLGRACFVAVADGALQVARMPDGAP